MSLIDRRRLLIGTAAASAFPAIARAVSIAPDVRSGTLNDIDHVVILMQENRSFDHYFGTLQGVRGFSDPYPAPVPAAGNVTERDVFLQHDGVSDGPQWLAPFPLTARQTFEHMRVEGTPHGWPDAQAAWDEGRMGQWPEAKRAHSMGYFEREDIPFQYALADAFTVCDGYHCSLQTGTNPNRLMLWSGTNDASGEFGGPAIGNSHDRLATDGGWPEPYRWTTYVERLQAAGVDWRVYQDMDDNFTDNPLIGFKTFQDSLAGVEGSDPALAERGLSTRKLDGLRADALAGRLPQVSYIVATAEGSEHPGPSSPAQGAAYTAEVIDALTADPAVWARTVLLITFDENDGFFDHVPPPAPPSRDSRSPGSLRGASTIDTRGEYHDVPSEADARQERPEYLGRPYGLGARVPMWVVSPWSRGGRVCSEVFDHTSIIRLLEARFGVPEPNISPWRRAVCGDLTSAFDFARRDPTSFPQLPETRVDALRAAALPGRTTPPTPERAVRPVQAAGIRFACPTPYALDCRLDHTDEGVALRLVNDGRRTAVFHVYDRLRLEDGPRRYTVEGGKTLQGLWPRADRGYDIQVMGPDGFHRRFASGELRPRLQSQLIVEAAGVTLQLDGEGAFTISTSTMSRSLLLRAGSRKRLRLDWADANQRYAVEIVSGAERHEYGGRSMLAP